MREYFWQSKPWQAFKNFAIIFSFVINFVLLLVLLLAAPLIIPGVDTIAKPLVSGLNQSFVDMGEATITRTIDVEDQIPIRFDVPLDTVTTVVLNQPVPLEAVPAQFVLPGGGGFINGSVSLNLPAGLALPVQLTLDVPVSQTIPIELAVDVSIPLEETELGGPFNALQQLFTPLDNFLRALPASNDDLFERVTDAPAAPEGVPVTSDE